MMKNIGKVVALLTIFALLPALISTAKAQTPTENMKIFFDSEIPGIKIQVNATAEAQPNEYINVSLSMQKVTDVHIKYFNLSIFGFINGTFKALMSNITDYDFPLSAVPIIYNCTFEVPERVWGIIHGDIILKYDVNYTITPGPGWQTMPYDLAFGLSLTTVENVYLKNLEEEFVNLNQTYWKLYKNYTELQGSLNELGNTRIAVGVLAVIAAIFVVSTLYLVLRKPKQYW